MEVGLKIAYRNIAIMANNSSFLFHWNEGGNVTTADGASLFGFDELFTAVLADTEVAAWHDERVLFV